MTEIALRVCPVCHETHPPLTTCAGGWSPWDGSATEVLTPASERWTYLVRPSEAAACTALARASIRDRGRSGERERGISRLDRNIGGYMAEVALARLLGYPDWMPKRIRRGDWHEAGDGPHGYGVRWCDDPSKRLLVYAGDAPTPHVSVVGPIRPGSMFARGWLLPSLGFIDKWRADFGRDTAAGQRACYLVPTRYLRPMEELV